MFQQNKKFSKTNSTIFCFLLFHSKPLLKSAFRSLEWGFLTLKWNLVLDFLILKWYFLLNLCDFRDLEIVFSCIWNCFVPFYNIKVAEIKRNTFYLYISTKRKLALQLWLRNEKIWQRKIAFWWRESGGEMLKWLMESNPVLIEHPIVRFKSIRNSKRRNKSIF